MKVLWFTWKDPKNPQAGGAELVNHELAKRLVQNGHRVTFITSGFKGALKEEKIDGYKVIRIGSRWTVYWKAYKYYKKHLKSSVKNNAGNFHIVIDEINTIPFFTKYFVKEKSLLFIHQLCREIWFYEMLFPLNIIGYLLEPLYLNALSNKKVITVSKSTERDLRRFGYKKQNIHVISEGIELEPLKFLTANDKYEEPTILSFGSIRAMKRTDHIVKAFEIAKQTIPTLRLALAGDASSTYGTQVVDEIEHSPFKDSIFYVGKVDIEGKLAMMKKSHIICATSVKEGWGLVVTEANSQGTPAVVYNVDGLRDSVKHEKTGLICKENTPKELARNIVTLLQNHDQYSRLRRDAWQWSQSITFDKAYKDFMKVLVSI